MATYNQLCIDPDPADANHPDPQREDAADAVADTPGNSTATGGDGSADSLRDDGDDDDTDNVLIAVLVVFVSLSFVVMGIVAYRNSKSRRVTEQTSSSSSSFGFRPTSSTMKKAMANIKKKSKERYRDMDDL